MGRRGLSRSFGCCHSFVRRPGRRLGCCPVFEPRPGARLDQRPLKALWVPWPRGSLGSARMLRCARHVRMTRWDGFARLWLRLCDSRATRSRTRRRPGRHLHPLPRRGCSGRSRSGGRLRARLSTGFSCIAERRGTDARNGGIDWRLSARRAVRLALRAIQLGGRACFARLAQFAGLVRLRLSQGRRRPLEPLAPILRWSACMHPLGDRACGFRRRMIRLGGNPPRRGTLRRSCQLTAFRLVHESHRGVTVEPPRLHARATGA